MSNQTPELVVFRGAVYRKALMLRRPPAPSPAGATPPGGGTPPDYYKIKRCILKQVPGKEEFCNRLSVTIFAVSDLQMALRTFGEGLKMDDINFDQHLQSVQEHTPKLVHEVEKLVFMGQQAHKALKSLKHQ